MMDSCDLMSFLPLFQSHQNAYGDNECLCAMESHLLLKKDSRLSGNGIRDSEIGRLAPNPPELMFSEAVIIIILLQQL